MNFVDRSVHSSSQRINRVGEISPLPREVLQIKEVWKRIRIVPAFCGNFIQKTTVRAEKHNNIRRIFDTCLIIGETLEPLLPASTLQCMIGNSAEFLLMQSFDQLRISIAVKVVLAKKFLLLVQVKSNYPYRLTGELL